jgi:hypothetical protein
MIKTEGTAMWKKVGAGIIAGVVLFGSVGFAAETDHWVFGELKDYKQKIVLYQDGIASSSPITPEEWKSFHGQVLNSGNLNDPITLENWAIGLKMALDLPEVDRDKMIQFYVHDLGSGKDITRENAVGGLVKLLTGSYIGGSVTGEELKSSKALVDRMEISEMQQTLVERAYIMGLLDSTVKDKFRPKDKLTNAEAVSILYHVTVKLAYTVPNLPANHWLRMEMESAYSAEKVPNSLKKVLRRAFKDPLNADRNIPVELWHDMLLAGLYEVPNDKALTSGYTLKLEKDGGILRDRAVAGMITLAGAARDVTSNEQEKIEAAFSDYKHAYEKDKLAIAQVYGLLKGRTDGEFVVNGYLTYAEAAALIIRASSIRPHTQHFKYENSTYNFSMELPKSWEGNYEVVESENHIVFNHKPWGELFSIDVWTKEKWSTEGEALAKLVHLSKIGEMGGYIFSFRTPTDVQYNPDDDKMKREYISMSNDIEHIKNTFQFKR